MGYPIFRETPMRIPFLSCFFAEQLWTPIIDWMGCYSDLMGFYSDSMKYDGLGGDHQLSNIGWRGINKGFPWESLPRRRRNKWLAQIDQTDFTEDRLEYDLLIDPSCLVVSSMDWNVPSGKLTTNYGKSPFFSSEKLTISIAMFNSYGTNYTISMAMFNS